MTARRRRCTRPSRFIERAVALEVARRREDEVGPADGELVEHRDRDHALRLLGERAHARVGGGLVAGDDQQPDRLGVRLVLVGGGGPGLGDAAAVRRRGQVEGAAAGLAVEAERMRELGESRSAASARARPDEDRRARLRGASSPRALRRLGELAAARQPRRRGFVGVACRRARSDDLGAVAARLP